MSCHVMSCLDLETTSTRSKLRPSRKLLRYGRLAFPRRLADARGCQLVANHKAPTAPSRLFIRVSRRQSQRAKEACFTVSHARVVNERGLCEFCYRTQCMIFSHDLPHGHHRCARRVSAGLLGSDSEKLLRRCMDPNR